LARAPLTRSVVQSLEARQLLSGRTGSGSGDSANPYLTHDVTAKTVTISGYAAGSLSADVIEALIPVAGTLRVSIDIGADALPAYVTDVPIAEVTRVNINSGDGDDTIRYEGHIIAELRAGDGDDTISVSRTPLPVGSTFSGVAGSGDNGDDIIRYGSFDAQTPGSLEDFDGLPSLSGGAGTDTMILDDRAGGRAIAYSVASSRLTRPGAKWTFDYTYADRTELLASNVGSTFAISAVNAPLTLRAGAGDDRFTLGDASNRLDSISSPLVIDGGTGADSALLRDDGSGSLAIAYAFKDDVLTRNARTLSFPRLESVTLRSGAGTPNAYDVTPSATTRLTLGDTTALSAHPDTLLIRGSNAGNARHTRSADTAGLWTFSAAQDVAYTGMTSVASPSLVQRQQVLLDTLPIRLRYTFADDVGPTLGVDDLKVHDAVGSDVAVTAVSWDAASLQATFTLAAGVLPDGVYTATLASTGVSAGIVTLDAPRVDTFAVFAGDLNGDRTVNFADLVVLAQNYNQSGRSYHEGNIDYSADGTVNFADLVLLAQRYGRSLAAAPLASMKPAVTAVSRKRREPVGVIDSGA
jgi:hypothetical protein